MRLIEDGRVPPELARDALSMSLDEIEDKIARSTVSWAKYQYREPRSGDEMEI